MAGVTRWIRGLDPELREEVTAFHRPLWDRLRDELTANRIWGQWMDYDRYLMKSLVRLLRQGYGYTEIGMMFGVCRERVRQWAKTYDIKDVADAKPTTGTLRRVWDDDLNHFRAVSEREIRQREARQRIAERKQRRVNRMAVTRAKHVLIMQQLVGRLKRTPTLKEVEAAIGDSIVNIAGWWGFRHGPRHKSNEVGTYKEAYGRLYAAVGLKPRDAGAAGHV